MPNELKDMSLSELRKLAKDVDKAIAAQEKRARKDALAEARAVAAKHGVALSDLLADTPAKLGPKVGKKRAKAGPKKAKAPAKYRNPADASQTWSGRGRRPDWINAAITAGKDISTFEI